MTKDQADARRAELARVIVTKQDERIKELETAIQVMAACIRAELKVPIGADDPMNEVVREAHKRVNENPIAWAAVRSV